MRVTSAPAQYCSSSTVMLNVGVVLTRICRSTRLRLLQPLSSVTYSCTTYSPGVLKVWLTTGPLVLVVPSSKSHRYSTSVLLPWAVEAVPSKVTVVPWQIMFGIGPSMVATAVGYSQGTVHWKLAAKLPVPLPLEVNTKVRQPVVLNTVPLTIRPCSWVPV